MTYLLYCWLLTFCVCRACWKMMSCSRRSPILPTPAWPMTTQTCKELCQRARSSRCCCDDCQTCANLPPSSPLSPSCPPGAVPVCMPAPPKHPLDRQPIVSMPTPPLLSYTKTVLFNFNIHITLQYRSQISVASVHLGAKRLPHTSRTCFNKHSAELDYSCLRVFNSTGWKMLDSI